jgi:hypothetical protein
MLLLLLPAKTGTSSQLKLKWSLMQWCILNRLEFLIIPTASTHQQWERVTICSKRVTTVYVRRGLIWSPLHPLNCTRRRRDLDWWRRPRRPRVVSVAAATGRRRSARAPTDWRQGLHRRRTSAAHLDPELGGTAFAREVLRGTRRRGRT